MKKLETIVAVLISVFVMLAIETGLLMIVWNYVLHEVINARKITMAESLTAMCFIRFVLTNNTQR